MLKRRFISSVRLLMHGSDLKTGSISLNNFKVPPINHGEVLLKLAASPYNVEDKRIFYGKYPIQLPSSPFCLGTEGCFYVQEVAPDVESFEKGDLVSVIPEVMLDDFFNFGFFGCWTSHAVVSTKYLYKLPNDLPISLAASIKVNPVTALCILNNFVTLNRGDFVIQNGANNYLGQCIIQFCYARGYKTVNIINDTENSDEIKNDLFNLGADHVFTVSEASEKTKENFKMQHYCNLGVDVYGGEFTRPILRNLCPGASLVQVDNISCKCPKIDPVNFCKWDITLSGFWFTMWTKRNQIKYVELLNEAVDAANNGQLKMPLGVDYYTFNDWGNKLVSDDFDSHATTGIIIY